MCALNPDKVQITQYRDQCLNLGDQEECDISSKKLLVWFRIFKGRLNFYMRMYNSHQNQSAYPECQHGIEWRHGRTISIHFINRLCFDLNRRCHKASDFLRIMR